MKAKLVRMTGPHPSQFRAHKPVWNVAIVDAERRPLGTVYRVFSFRRAVFLSSDMARDRRLYLQIEANQN